ncbi:MAG: sigma-70 family RNA polymerase sigma factor [Nannocystaceae bacterium]|nr:sigma-70 family RNA polymerase sigma factor [Nannocystaceae bacterium]
MSQTVSDGREQIASTFGLDGQTDAAALGRLVAQLDKAWARAREAWPKLQLDKSRYLAWLAARTEAPDDVANLDVVALMLTCAVCEGCLGAVEAFHEAHGPDIDVALARTRLAHDARDDARQVVLAKLLVPGSEKLSAYGGRGSLSHWVRAVTVRQAISLSRRRGTMERVVAEPSAQDPDVAPDPELAFLKAHYRERFKAAFSETVEALPAPDRTLLRLRFVDGLTLDQVARVRDVHRATAARHLARLRKLLLAGVRERLQADAGLANDREVASALRLVESNLELSLPRILRTSG